MKIYALAGQLTGFIIVYELYICLIDVSNIIVHTHDKDMCRK